jgi:hypothetical protein
VTISGIEMVYYTEQQMEIVYKHDIDFDERIPEDAKPMMREQFYALFQESKAPVV